MAIRSIDNGSPVLRQSLDANRAASESEKEAQRRIEQSNRRVEDARAQDDIQLDRLKEQHAQQVDAELTREQAELQKIQNQSYERIRNAQRAQAQQMNELKRRGEKDYTHLQEHYRATTHAEETRGQEELDRLSSQNHRKIQYEQGLGSQQIEHIRKEAEAQSSMMRDRQAERVSKLYRENEEHFAKLSEQSEESRERVRQKFDTQYAQGMREASETLDDLNARATQELNRTRLNTSAKLNAYQRRQSDPFYKMIDLDARLRDSGDHYVLTAVIPPHEQKHITVSIKGDQIVLSGYRNNSEKAELSPGHSVGTASFQSFEETFPLTWPVDKSKLSREFDGDLVIVRVPKKNKYAIKEPYQATPVKKARVEPPHFPENIHIEPEQALQQPVPEKPRKKAENDLPQPSVKTRTSGTIS